MCRQENHTGIETHGKDHAKSKIGAISGPTKWALVQQKILEMYAVSCLQCRYAGMMQYQLLGCEVKGANYLNSLEF